MRHSLMYCWKKTLEILETLVQAEDSGTSLLRTPLGPHVTNYPYIHVYIELHEVTVLFQRLTRYCDLFTGLSSSHIALHNINYRSVIVYNTRSSPYHEVLIFCIYDSIAYNGCKYKFIDPHK